MLRICYFARLRELLGVDSEQVELPEQVVDVVGLMTWLMARGEVWQQAFSGNMVVRVAINQRLSHPQDAIADGDEIAFFPPVTGG